MITTDPERHKRQITGWAQAARAFGTALVFLILDTTGLQKDADIIRIYLMDQFGTVLFDRYVFPGRYHVSNPLYTGITMKQIETAQPLAAHWSELTTLLRGKVVLSYGLDFVHERLDENAAYYGLPELFFLGKDLKYQVAYWFHETNQFGYRSLKLTEACSRFGYAYCPVGVHAPERAAAQCFLFGCLAEPETALARPEPAPEEPVYEFEDEDEHPF